MEWYDAHGWALCVPLFYPGCVCVHRNRVTQNESLLRNLPWMDGWIYFLVSFFCQRKKRETALLTAATSHMTAAPPLPHVQDRHWDYSCQKNNTQ